MFVLGIDPGLSRCGYGVIEINNRKERAVAAGVIRTSPEYELPNRLLEFRNEFRKLLQEFTPEVIAIERVLFQRNVRTAISVGQVIGVVMVEGIDETQEVINTRLNELMEDIDKNTAVSSISNNSMSQLEFNYTIGR